MRTPQPDDGLTKVPVQAIVLRATAHLLDLLGDFFTNTDPAIHLSLGSHLIERHSEETTADSITEAVLLINDLSEAAELLHALAGDYHPGDGTGPDQQ